MITIAGKEYQLFYNVYGEFAYEKNAGKRYPYGTALSWDEYILFYSMLEACNAGMTMTFEEFIQHCNEDVTLMVQFKHMMSKTFDVMFQFKKKLETESEKASL